MTNPPDPHHLLDLPDPVPVHYDWAPDALKEGTAPRCRGRDQTTDALLDVTCPECMEFIERVIGAWCRTVPKEAL